MGHCWYLRVSNQTLSFSRQYCFIDFHHPGYTNTMHRHYHLWALNTAFS